jgi:hypothetical protein
MCSPSFSFFLCLHRQFITYLQGVELPALTARMREHLERAVKEKTQPQLLRADTSTEWQDGHMWRFVMEVLYVAGTCSPHHIPFPHHKFLQPRVFARRAFLPSTQPVSFWLVLRGMVPAVA